ncbi:MULTISPECIES: PadR family transcriptional regulator [unclassified Herbaspirillum]|uniref:PadR family transcriptional regulator n=1 Tax=unclassified Herbaspirillum TaxID=2624150 RepID=UPI00115354DA|nr:MULTISPECIES: PadR family transcriptional regulator [unclassified Herbaspirillum]MBB5391473.1 DNA-binding PadR family transcriptional regulator [Herbaspirillum sp. SJZ102]TQK12842.1 PadR family transcriptional regulator [Herbaspirillum sp. SJZ130]TQK14846.1 PadR family transcriptional regulator [Herbaspirillum sp. SJZ106]
MFRHLMARAGHGPKHHRFDRPHHGAGGMFDEGGPRGREGGRGARMFEQGALRIVMLHLLQEKPRHGYEIIKAIEQLVGGGYSPSPGVVYPTLTLLEEMGYATVAAEEGGKKLYRISAEGEADLKANEALLQQVLHKFEMRRQERPDADSPELRRAVQNFRMALHTRLAKGALSKEELHAVVDIIDQAAVAVERV